MYPLISSRNDRQVWNCRVRMGPDASVHALSSAIEEALRLCTLPGENEGRVYYFRRLQVSGLPEYGHRRTWLGAFENCLLGVARTAVHGAEAGASAANAIYFRSLQEACEALLFRIARRRPLDAWFWPLVTDSPPAAGAATLAAGAIAKLAGSDASWFAVAAAVFSSGDPVMLLKLLPAAAVSEWLKELGSQAGLSTAPRLPGAALHALERAAKGFPGGDVRVLWLAALAVILASPSQTDSRTVVPRAQAVLRSLQLAREHSGPAAGDDSSRPLVECAGVPTEGAGLYFLLNALRYLGLAGTEFSPTFLAHLFRLAARLAGIRQEDPILLWATQTLEREGSEPVDGRRLKIWFRKVRRWCWRHGRIGWRAIVRRRGRVTLTRTDLDVTLALDSADVRIRLMGLDLNPGWLPWFGRVVRFHYLDRGELHV